MPEFLRADCGETSRQPERFDVPLGDIDLKFAFQSRGPTRTGYPVQVFLLNYIRINQHQVGDPKVRKL